MTSAFVVFPESNLDRASRAVAALGASLPGVELLVVGGAGAADPATGAAGSAAYVPAVADLLRVAGIRTAFVYGDAAGSATAPALAWELGGCLLTDCIAVADGPGGPRFTRRRATTDVLDDYELPRSVPAVVTVSPEIRADPVTVPAADPVADPPRAHGSEPGSTPAVDRVRTADLRPSSMFDRWRAGYPVGPPAIAEADLLVGLGRGCTELAAEAYEPVVGLLGAQVSATRQAIEWKLAAADGKLGDTGLKVAPRTYLALGLSGANQHLSGIWGDCSIVAVNRNPYAAVHEAADIAVVADVSEFMTALRFELSTRLGLEPAHTSSTVD